MATYNIEFGGQTVEIQVGENTQVAVNAAATATTQADRAEAAADALSERQFSNVWPDPLFTKSLAGQPNGWDNPAYVVVARNGIRRMRTPSSASASQCISNKIPVTGMPSAKVSVSVVIDNKAITASGADIRVRLQAYDASNNVLSWTGIAGNDDAANVATQYTRYLPTAAVTAEQRLDVLTNSALPAGTASLSMNVRAATLVQADISHFVLREGPDGSWVFPEAFGAPYINTGHGTSWISATGSDTTGDGSASNPWATFDKALDAMNWIGDINVLPGSYSNVQLHAQRQLNISIVGHTDATFARPVFRYGTKLTSITKTAAQTKVYQAAATIAGGQPNWIWLDSVPDAQTAIADIGAYAVTQGRSFRLPCTKIWATTATTLAAAKAEIDAASTPKCFYDSATNILYFSIPGGGDATASNVYWCTSTGFEFAKSKPLFYSAAASALRIYGLDVRYGGFNMRPFRNFYGEDIEVTGAPSNGIDIAYWATLKGCRAGGSGSSNGPLGDGLNGHNFLEGMYEDCWFFDNRDDGESAHERCRITGVRSLAEFNGGNGFIPAFGAQGMYDTCTSRSNRQISTNKFGGFQAYANEIGGLDPSAYTTLEAHNCTAISEYIGFGRAISGDAGQDITKIIATASNCRTINCTTAYDNMNTINECSDSGSVTVKTGTPTVPTFTVVG